MIEISTISARKLPIPHGCEFHFIVTASIGDASVSSAPVKPVLDHRLGSSVTFREPLVLPCYVDGSVVDLRTFGITVQFRSVCGTMHLGSAVCRVTKQWVPVVPSGEAMVSFFLSEPVPLTHAAPDSMPFKQRPATAGPAVRTGAPGTTSSVPRTDREDAVPLTSEYSGTLAVHLRGISGLAIPTSTPVSVYVVAQFAMMEVHSTAIEVIPESDGHRGAWGEGPNQVVTFEVLPSNISRILTLSVFGAWIRAGSAASVASGSGGPHHLLGLAKLDVPTNLGGENQRFATSVAISGHPRSKLDVEVVLTYLKPRKEGAGGRPLSAYPRRNPATSGSGEFSKQLAPLPASSLAPTAPQDEDEVILDGAPALQSSGATAAKLRSKVVAGKKAWDESPSDAFTSFQAALMAKLEESISSAVGAACTKILERLGSLEQRVARTEEMLAQTRPATAPSHRPGSGYSGARIPKAPSSLGGAASRPSSADSVGGAPYDVSHSIVTDAQLRAKFMEYDAKDRGFITVPQLIHFYRSNSAFGDDEDEAKILKYFDYCGLRVRSSEGVSFDDFAKVALKLAQR